MQCDIRVDLTSNQGFSGQETQTLKCLADMPQSMTVSTPHDRASRALTLGVNDGKTCSLNAHMPRTIPTIPRPTHPRAEGGGFVCHCAAPIFVSNASFVKAPGSVSLSPNLLEHGRVVRDSPSSQAASAPTQTHAPQALGPSVRTHELRLRMALLEKQPTCILGNHERKGKAKTTFRQEDDMFQLPSEPELTGMNTAPARATKTVQARRLKQ